MGGGGRGALEPAERRQGAAVRACALRGSLLAQAQGPGRLASGADLLVHDGEELRVELRALADLPR